MTIRSRRCLHLLAGPLALVFVSMCAIGAGSVASIDRLMDASGMRHALSQVPASITESMDSPQPGVDLPPQLRIALKDAATQAFRAEQLIESVRGGLTRDLAETQIQDALVWFDSPLGKRITDLENKASEPAAMERIEAYGRELQQRPPAQSRRTLVQSVNDATGSTEVAAVVMESIALAAALGMNAAQPKQAQIPAEILREQIKEALPQIQAQADAIVMVSLFYTYRTLPDHELAGYLRFLKSASGAAYSRSGSNATREALTQAIGQFMVAIPKALERSRGSGRI